MSAWCFDIFAGMIEEDKKLFYTMNHLKKESLLLKERKEIFRFIKQVLGNSNCPNKVKFLSILYFDIHFSKNDCFKLSSDMLTSLLSLIISLAIKVEGGAYEGRNNLTITELSKFTDVHEDVLYQLELRILKTLKWKTSFVSPEDLIYLFFDTHLKEGLTINETKFALEASTYFYKNLFLFDENPYQYTGVAIAICCISQSLIEMGKKDLLNRLLKMVKKQDLVEEDDMNACWNEMQFKINEIIKEK